MLSSKRQPVSTGSPAVRTAVPSPGEESDPVASFSEKSQSIRRTTPLPKSVAAAPPSMAVLWLKEQLVMVGLLLPVTKIAPP